MLYYSIREITLLRILTKRKEKSSSSNVKVPLAISSFSWNTANPLVREA
jgi:hypothetical protein